MKRKSKNANEIQVETLESGCTLVILNPISEEGDTERVLTIRNYRGGIEIGYAGRDDNSVYIPTYAVADVVKWMRDLSELEIK